MTKAATENGDKSDDLSLFGRGDLRQPLNDENEEDDEAYDAMMNSNVNDARMQAADAAATTSTSKPFYTTKQMASMLGYFSSQYNIINISLVIPILKLKHKDFTEEDISAVASTLFYGTMIGQVLGGYLGDTRLGKFGALRLVMVVQIVAALGSAILVAGENATEIFGLLSTWRFFLGIGAGGVYPLAACLSAENENEESEEEHHNRSSVNTTASVSNVNHSDRRDVNDTFKDSHEEKVEQMKRVVTTFAMQGVAFIAVPILTVPLLHLLGEDQMSLTWRIILGVGSIPGFIMICMMWKLSRVTANEYTSLLHGNNNNNNNNRDNQQHVSDDDAVVPNGNDNNLPDELINSNNASYDDANIDNSDITNTDTTVVVAGASVEAANANHEQQQQQTKGLWDTIRSEPNLTGKLLGTAGTWFLMDVVFFGNTLFQPIVLEAVFGGHHSSSSTATSTVDMATSSEEDYSILVKATTDSLILTAMALPGYAVTTYFIGKRTCYCITQTPRYIQLQGFAAWSILYTVIGLSWTSLKSNPSLLVTLYGLTFFFANYGPNTTTFILPSLVYSQKCRSTLNGVSAAFAKIGAVFAATVFGPATDLLGADVVMLICAAFSVVGYGLTYCFVRIPGTDNEQQHDDDEENDGADTSHANVV